MQECNLESVCTDAWLLVNHLEALPLQSRYLCLNVVHLKRQMMDSFPPFRDELCNSGVGTCGFEQFNSCFTDLEECCFHLLIGDFLCVFFTHPKEFCK